MLFWLYLNKGQHFNLKERRNTMLTDKEYTQIALKLEQKLQERLITPISNICAEMQRIEQSLRDSDEFKTGFKQYTVPVSVAFTELELKYWDNVVFKPESQSATERDNPMLTLTKGLGVGCHFSSTSADDQEWRLRLEVFGPRSECDISNAPLSAQEFVYRNKQHAHILVAASRKIDTMAECAMPHLKLLPGYLQKLCNTARTKIKERLDATDNMLRDEFGL